ncbi:MAG: putative transport system permease protein [Pseudomonadota bacterium]|nr:putative transport system permease protein [Pseudomonadota bacterium]
MRAIPLSYVMRNLWVRRVTTALTAGGMALVVFVFATVLMMSEGINETMVATGQPDNVVVMRKGAATEIHSNITRDQANAIDTLAGVGTDNQGRKLVSREVVVLNNLPKRDGTTANVILRGMSEFGVSMRPQIKLAEGRMFRPGTSEIVAGKAVARGFANVSVGNSLHFAGRDWLVVGIMDAERSAFDSEIWVDSHQAMQAFRRPAYSTILFRLSRPDALAAARKTVDSDPRMQLDLKRETQFYAEQSESMSNFIKVLGLSLSVIFSIGAIVGAMITMFAAVASRIGEIGTLRALGFRREAVLIAFLGESLGLSMVGGLIGLGAASLMQSVDVSAVNYSNFSEMAFRFRFTGPVALQSLAFALFMGVICGFIPAWRAARLSIIECLRQA